MPQRPPSIVVLLTDQQRWDTTGTHGNPMGLTPNFDRMATHGTHFARAFTCQPVCGPARSSIQTGCYATRTGCWRNGIALAPSIRTLAHHFNESGYRTAYIGKWHLASRDPVPKEERGGYDYWLAANVLEFTSEPYRTVVYDGGCNAVRLPGYRVDALTDAAIRYIAANQADPFLLFVSFLEPHHQNHVDDYPPPDGYRQRYSGGWMPPDLQALGGSAAAHLGGYYGMVKRLDEALGRVLDALRSLDLLEHTIVLFTSDHGCHFKTRNSEYKRSCHESSIRIPMAARGPGFDGGGRVNRLVSLIDVAPTLLEAAGLEVPESCQGRSMLPLLHGARCDWPDDVFVQISESQVGRTVRTHRWKYSVSAPTGVGWDDPSAQVYQEEFLYDLRHDPHELRNLIHEESHSGVADRLCERLLERMVAAGEDEPAVHKAERHPSGQRRVPAAEESE